MQGIAVDHIDDYLVKGHCSPIRSRPLSPTISLYARIPWAATTGLRLPAVPVEVFL